MPWFKRKKGDQVCVVKGTPEEPGEEEGCHDTDEEANAQLAALNAIEDDKSHMATVELGPLSVYKSGDTWRWRAISSRAVLDKEAELVGLKAYTRAVERAMISGNWGELDQAHVDGTDVGKCTSFMPLGNQLVADGHWADGPAAEKARESIQRDPDYWGISLKFRFVPALFDGVEYGDIEIIKHTMLPRHKAASYGTAITAWKEANKMATISDSQKEDLRALGRSEEEIAELERQNAEKSAENENVKTKEAEEGDALSLWEKLGAMLRGKPQEETADADTAPVAAEEDTEVEQPKSDGQSDEAPTFVLDEEAIKQVGEAAAATLTSSIEQATAPLVEKIAELTEQHNALVAELEQAKARIQEAEKPIEDKVQARLQDLPPVVKVSATQTPATLTTESVNEAIQKAATSAAAKLMSDIKAEADRKAVSQNIPI
jgi:hypothetical protein